jgi:multiple sugar transport system ATP-binding protein
MVKVYVKGVNKSFGDIQAVKDLSFTVNHGEFFCLLGPSGCGKTTTLRMLAGLEKPDSGEIYFDELLVNDLSPQERDVAMVFQFYALYPGTTVYKNLALPLEARKMSKSEIDRAVRETAKLLRISDILRREVGALTIGERQRVALGRALVRKARVYLLDEPLTNLDAKLRATMRVELIKLQKELKMTTIYVTHDQIEAITMADRIGVMNLGVLQQVGTHEELYNSPSNKFVAGFIGTPPMNFIDCSLNEAEKTLEMGGSATININSDAVNIIKSKATSHELILGVRPEDIVIVPERGFKAVIDSSEFLGDKQVLHLTIDGSTITAVAPGETEFQSGREVRVSFRKFLIFDRKSEIVLAKG